MWDSKYTTNINTEMNYWPAEVANLGECAEPLFRMIRELADQGAGVAREHYGARGWVFHQNTDLWRVAAPMDGPNWGGFATGGAWLATHLWEHYLFTGDQAFLRGVLPGHERRSRVPAGPPRAAPEVRLARDQPVDIAGELPARARATTAFFDEVTGSMSNGTALVAGSAIDTQLIGDLFAAVSDGGRSSASTPTCARRSSPRRAKLAPMRVGRTGDLQEWLEDWGQREKSHRHISHLYGLFPGNQISPRRTPDLAAASRVVLDQRGLPGNGWASAWKAARWARLLDGAQRPRERRRMRSRNYTTDSLFSICSKAMQVDGRSA